MAEVFSLSKEACLRKISLRLKQDSVESLLQRINPSQFSLILAALWFAVSLYIIGAPRPIWEVYLSESWWGFSLRVAASLVFVCVGIFHIVHNKMVYETVKGVLERREMERAAMNESLYGLIGISRDAFIDKLPTLIYREHSAGLPILEFLWRAHCAGNKSPLIAYCAAYQERLENVRIRCEETKDAPERNAAWETDYRQLLTAPTGEMLAQKRPIESRDWNEYMFSKYPS